jgi:hypothetical protein
MAKLNWEKVKRQSDQQSARDLEWNDPARKNFGMFVESGIWSLKGKHYGKSIKSLSVDYLGWVIDNITGIHRELAEKELYRRYNSNT